MDDLTVKLATLIGSRICHDLISPIGAINNGLELFGLAGTPAAPELDLISESAASADARVRFFRIAFGLDGDQMLNPADIVAVLDSHAHGGRVSYRWHPPGPQKRSEVRLAFLALLCCETALPFGGSAEVSRESETWRIAMQSDRLALDPALWEALEDGSGLASEAIGPAHVQFALLPLLAAQARRRLSLEMGTTQAAILF